jgi:hypothetical protein
MKTSIPEGSAHKFSVFLKLVCFGAVNDEDGTAYFSDGTCLDDEFPVKISEFVETERPAWATHIVWIEK